MSRTPTIFPKHTVSLSHHIACGKPEGTFPWGTATVMTEPLRQRSPPHAQHPIPSAPPRGHRDHGRRTDRAGRRRHRIGPRQHRRAGGRSRFDRADHVPVLPRLRRIADDRGAHPDAGRASPRSRRRSTPTGTSPRPWRRSTRRSRAATASRSPSGSPRSCTPPRRRCRTGSATSSCSASRSPRTPPARRCTSRRSRPVRAGETAWIEIPAEGQDHDELEAPAPSRRRGRVGG